MLSVFLSQLIHRCCYDLAGFHHLVDLDKLVRLMDGAALSREFRSERNHVLEGFRISTAADCQGLQVFAAYVNIAGGIRMNEPAMDLGIVMAILSSYRDKPIDEKTIVFGEVGLSGEVRAVSQAAQRVQEAKKLGFHTVIMPAVSIRGMGKIDGIEIIGVRTLKDVLRSL